MSQAAGGPSDDVSRRVRRHASAHFSDSDDDDFEDSQLNPSHVFSGTKPNAAATSATSTSTAVSLGGPSAGTSGVLASEGLRERSRAPYSSVPPSKPFVEAAADRAEPSASAGAASSGKGKERAQVEDLDDPEPEKDKEALFACHICLETPSADDCVITKCGHVFCWSDLSEWLESNPPATSQCPVCKSQIKDVQDDVIPIYSGGRSSKKEVDPRTRPRPKPKVTPAPPVPPSRGGLFGGGMQGFGPFWDIGGGPNAGAGAGGGGGWTVQAGVFPFPGLSLGWSNARGPAQVFGHNRQGGAMTAEDVHEQARIQQRNALIAFAVMIVLFTLLATVSDMD